MSDRLNLLSLPKVSSSGQIFFETLKQICKQGMEARPARIKVSVRSLPTCSQLHLLHRSNWLSLHKSHIKRPFYRQLVPSAGNGNHK